MFSDLTGRFPATARDGSQYILLSVYKRYIHLELLASRSDAAIIDAFTRTHQWFIQLGHFVQFQVMDNEAPKSLRQHFIAQDIQFEFVPPFTHRANKAERAIQTFKRHFISILPIDCHTHTSQEQRDERRRVRQGRAFSAKVRFAGTDSDQPTSSASDTLNLDSLGKPLTYSSAKRGPDKILWEAAEIEEIVRLIRTGTIFPIAHSQVPSDRWTNNEIVYYNPVVKQKRNDDGTIQYRVRGTAGGNLLDVPYDVSARTAGLDTVKLLVHSVISGDYNWMTIDIADFYLGTPLPASRYEYLRINLKQLPQALIELYNLGPLIYNQHVYFEIRKCMYGLPQAGKLSQTRLIKHLSENDYIQCPNTPCYLQTKSSYFKSSNQIVTFK